MSNIAGNNASYWPIDPSSAGPSPAKATSWPFFERPQGIRHHSWSAVESTTESASDGLSDNYILSHRPSVASSSNDPGDPACMDDASTTSIVNAKRPRGRPRKHPIVVADSSTKPVKSRSKTGCLTCRSRKKKCDEAKPVCMNCQKNNVVCQGYPSPEVWQGGKQKQPERSPSRTPSDPAQGHPGQRGAPFIMAAAPSSAISAVEMDLDQMLLEHYKRTTSRVLTLYSHVGQNPFIDIILPMAAVRPGLMHAVLSLAGTHICTQSADARVHDRQAYHLGRALRDLSTDSQLARGAVDDGIIAQSLILLLRSIVAGEHDGEYRVHMNAGRHLINSQRYANQDFHNFLVESCVYHEFIRSLTSLERRPPSLISRDLGLPSRRGLPTNTAYLSDFDHLFPYFTKITALRDRVRITRQAHQASHQRDVGEAQRIESELRGWTSTEATGTSRFIASQLFWKCARIYLRRTMTVSTPSDALNAVVEEGLMLLFRLGPNSSMQAILTMPIFLLGCATFEHRQRAHVTRAFDIHFAYKQCGSILHVRRVVSEIWTLMDQQNELSWDWETVILKMGLDFLVT